MIAFRIVQGALTNAQRHGEGTVVLRVTVNDPQVMIVDDQEMIRVGL